MKDFPFVQCLDPQRIHNRYTKEEMVVPCGHCSVCLRKKGNTNTLKCELESAAHKYTMFVTLTYDQINIPRVRYVEFGDKEVSFFDNTPRMKKYGIYDTEIARIPYSFDKLAKLREKVEHLDLPYCSVKDLQLFIKRFRKNIQKYSNEKIRYFGVAELGPLHYRPHFHLEFYFDDQKTYQVFYKVLAKSWKLGRVDSSLSKGKSSRYVAKYINGNCYLPRVYRTKGLCPFSTHSEFFGEEILRSKKKEVYENDFTSAIRTCMPFINNATDFTLWRSLQLWYFPKCRGFNGIPTELRKYAYKIYDVAREWSKKDSCIDQAKDIAEYCLNRGFNHFIPAYNDLFDYFYLSYRSLLDATKLNIVHHYDRIEFKEKFIKSIYTELRVSKHFLTNVCDDVPDNQRTKEIDRKLHLIETFYEYKNMEGLKRQLSIQNDLLQYYELEEYNFSPTVDTETGELMDDSILTNCIPYLYGNVDYDKKVYKETPLYRFMLEEDTQINLYSQKTKKMNDAYNLLNY